MDVIFGRRVSLVVVELDRPLGDVEGDIAVGTIVIFPAAMRLTKKIIDQRFDGLVNGLGLALDVGISPNCPRYLDLNRWERDGRYACPASMSSIWPLSP